MAPTTKKILPWLLALSLSMPCGKPAWAQPAGQDAADDIINADRPGIADSSKVVSFDAFQVESGLYQDFRRTGDDHSRAFNVPTLLRLGLGNDLEVRVEGNTYTNTHAYSSASGSSANQGASPTSIGLKYQFLDGDGWKRPSAGVIVRVFPPSGSGGLGTAHATGDLRLAIDWDFAPKWTLTTNVGAALYEDDARRTFPSALYAATLNYNLTPAVGVFVDTGMLFPEDRRGGNSMIVDVGATYAIGKDLQLDVSVGHGVSGVTSPALFLSAGISKRF